MLERLVCSHKIFEVVCSYKYVQNIRGTKGEGSQERHRLNSPKKLAQLNFS